MNLRRAVDTITGDPAVTSKIEIGVVALTAPLVGVAAVGYQVALARRVAAGLEEGLPEWDEPGRLVREGFWLAVVRLLYELPARLLLVGTLILAVRTLWLAAPITSAQWQVQVRPALAVLATGGLAVLAYNVVHGFISPGVTALYVQHGTLRACFSPVGWLRLVARQPGAYLQVWLLREAVGLAVRLVGMGAGLLTGLLPLVGPLAINLTWGWLLFVSLLLNGCLVGQLLQAQARRRLHPPVREALPAPTEPDPQAF